VDILPYSIISSISISLLSELRLDGRLYRLLVLGLHRLGGRGTGQSAGGVGHTGGFTGHPLFALVAITDGNGSALDGSGETFLRASTPCASDKLLSDPLFADAGSDDDDSTGFTVNFASNPPANFLNSGGSVNCCVLDDSVGFVAESPDDGVDEIMELIMFRISGGT
jgi:hypothetical protein